jgi:hypothetical protein
MRARQPQDETTIAQMAADLQRLGAWRTEGDTIRALVGRYPPLDVAELAGDARLAAFHPERTARRSA